MVYDWYKAFVMKLAQLYADSDREKGKPGKFCLLYRLLRACRQMRFRSASRSPVLCDVFGSGGSDEAAQEAYRHRLRNIRLNALNYLYLLPHY